MNRWNCVVMMLLLLMACQSTHYSYQPLPEAVPVNPNMIFLTFSVEQDSLQKSKINLIKQKIVEGKLKVEQVHSNLGDRLVVKQLDDQQQELASCSVDHPLHKRVEYANDQGILSSKVVILTKADFFIRVTLHDQARFIQVDEMVDGKTISNALFNIK